LSSTATFTDPLAENRCPACRAEFTSILGLPASIQYAWRDIASLQAAPSSAPRSSRALAAPATWLLSHLMGEGEVLHAIGHKR